MKKLFVLFLVLCSFTSISQSNTDSLLNVARNDKNGYYERAAAYYEISNIIEENSIELYCDKALEMLNMVDSAKTAPEKYYNLKGSIYANYGYYYRSKGLIKKAFENYFIAYRYSEKINDKHLLGNMQNNFGMLYYSQNQYKEAMVYYQKAIQTYRKLNDREHEARTYMNLAGTYQNTGNFNLAIYNFKRAMNMFIEQKDSFYVAFTNNNIAVCFRENGFEDSAFVYVNKSLSLFEKLNATDEIAWTYDIIAGLYTSQKQYDKAEPYCRKCIDIARERNLPSQLRSCLENLYLISKHEKNYKDALLYYIQSDSLQDSLINNNNRLLLAKSEVEYEFSKKEELLKLEAQKNALQFSEERKRNYVIIFSVIAILAISLFFGYMVYKSLKLEKQAKRTVLEQKTIIEEKQKEIIDSINYAKSLQEAILPPMALWKRQLPDSFILYKPKDIVAGDFYWMEKSQGLLFFAVADCTGHGVPGAMVSVVCSNALNRSILEFRLTKPGEILDKTRELVISTFEKSEKQVRDGMDISLCVLDTQTHALQWAGANNPLWYVRGKSMEKLNADKQPVGEYIDETAFTTQQLQLQQGDILYLFSDGYADQFGGPKGKKFKYKQLEELFIRNSALPMDEQAKFLEQAFDEWKGHLQQVDDVCVIGIRI